MIKFVHFNGTLKDWNENLNNGVYNGSIVYACVWDNDQPSYKIYAGISDILGPHKETVKYLYEIPSEKEWKQTIESVKSIVNQLTTINKDITDLKETTLELDSSIKEVKESIKILNSDETTEGSIKYQIIEALEKHKFTAEDFAKLVDKDSNVKVDVVDSSIKLTVDAANKAKITVGDVNPDDYQFEVDPGHGDYYVKEEIITEKLGAEPRRTAYIYIDEKWHVLDGNVDATNVFFKDGVNRTAAIGCLAGSDEIKNEGKNFNLKELLEYYLVQEIYPTDVKTVKAVAKADNYSISLQKPNALSTYMNNTNNLAEVGTAYTFKGISLVEKATHNGKDSYTSTQSKITGMKFGAASSLDGDVDLNKTSDESNIVTANATYTNNFANGVIKIELRNKNGFNGINNSSNAIYNNLNNEQTLSLPSQNGTILEGTNKLSLSWTNTASVSRTISGENVKALGPWYYASNKGKVDSEHVVSVEEVEWTQTSEATSATYSPTEFTVTGVYALYTNGGKVSLTATPGFKTTDCKYAEDCTKIPVYNYYSETTKTFYIQFGAIEIGFTKTHELYFPKSSENAFNISAYAFNPSSKEYDAIIIYNKVDEVKTINGMEYYVYKANDEAKDKGQGANEIKIQISKQ